MNQNLVKQMNLRFYKTIFGIFFIFILYSCSSDKNEVITYEISPSVDPNTSLDCTGVWANSPLCKERNEALIELKKLEPLFGNTRINEVQSGQDSTVQYEAWTVKQEGRDHETSSILKEIWDYNKEDCESLIILE